MIKLTEFLPKNLNIKLIENSQYKIISMSVNARPWFCMTYESLSATFCFTDLPNLDEIYLQKYSPPRIFRTVYSNHLEQHVKTHDNNDNKKKIENKRFW